MQVAEQDLVLCAATLLASVCTSRRRRCWAARLSLNRFCWPPPESWTQVHSAFHDACARYGNAIRPPPRSSSWWARWWLRRTRACPGGPDRRCLIGLVVEEVVHVAGSAVEIDRLVDASQRRVQRHRDADSGPADRTPRCALYCNVLVEELQVGLCPIPRSLLLTFPKNAVTLILADRSDPLPTPMKMS